MGGAMSVLLRKHRCYAEIYNDLDQEVVNLFRVLQHPEQASQLQEKLIVTPFAREEFELGYLACDEPVERARRLVILSFMGFGSNGHNKSIRTGFRANSNRSSTTPAHDWANYPIKLPSIIERLRGVIIENRDAMEVMLQHDSVNTLHYVDPPYIWETRSSAMHRNRAYNYELSTEDHEKLLDFLLALEGSVVISGYPHPLYDARLSS